LSAVVSFNKIHLFRIFQLAATLKNTNTAVWKGIHLVALVGLALRLALAFTSDTIHHPDETFQYLEQGHRIAFGYGYIPWEYRFGVRSYLIPLGISGLLSACRILNLDDPLLYGYLVKAVCCLVSTSLIYSLYFIGRRLASEQAGRLAAILACFWYELVYFAHRPIPEMLAAYCLTGALAFLLSSSDCRRPLCFGLLAGLAAALRLQYLLVTVLFCGYAGVIWPRKEALKALAGVLFILAVVGSLDYLVWGKFLISYYNSYLYNATYNLSSLFGSQNWYFYPAVIIIASTGVLPLLAGLALFLWRSAWLPLACVAGIVLSHALIPHKEYRFVLATIPLLLVVAAIAVTELSERFFSSDRLPLCRTTTTIVFAVISLVALGGALPYQKKIYPQPLNFRDPALQAYRFLNGEPGLAAVLNTYAPWWKTGGYFALHRDIPLYDLDHMMTSQIPWSEIGDVVSHIVSPVDDAVPPGFEQVARFGQVAVSRRTTPSTVLRKLAVPCREAMQKGVDDVYMPQVRRRF
jgi:hypothetical protein